MNAKPNDFPIPYPSQQPSDDLTSARSLVTMATLYLEDGKELGKTEVSSLFTLIFTAMETLEVIQIFLNNCECPDIEQQYQASRRTWVVQKVGAQ